MDKQIMFRLKGARGLYDEGVTGDAADILAWGLSTGAVAAMSVPARIVHHAEDFVIVRGNCEPKTYAKTREENGLTFYVLDN